MIRPGDGVAVVAAFNDGWQDSVALFGHGDDLMRDWGGCPARPSLLCGSGRTVAPSSSRATAAVICAGGEFLGEGLGDVHGYNGLC